jgi:cell wall-associated NlpC family hydrolase
VSGDCSSSVTAWSLWGQRAARVEPHDPNHLAFHAGYTGTQIFHGSAVSLSSLDLADFVFYGTSYSLAGITHVALYAGAGLVYTNGHYPMQLAPVHYRGDARGARRYPFPEA